MLEAMRHLALQFLHDKMSGGLNETPETFYNRIRSSEPERLFPFLVEDIDLEGRGEGKARYYTLRPSDDDLQIAILEAIELKESDIRKLPFNQPSGAQSAALGPVIKRTAPTGKKPRGPSPKIQHTTLKAFKEIGEVGESWSAYFASVHECWVRPKLEFESNCIDAPKGAYAAAIEAIEEKGTVLLAYKGVDGKLPGEMEIYRAYLQKVLALSKYTTRLATIRNEQTCPLCGIGHVDVYPNALRGAGINLANLDRAGAFAGLDRDSAWKRFALCLACADLLYVFWNHVAGNFTTRIAGEKSLERSETITL